VPTLACVTTFPAVLQQTLRADAARPLVTFYDDASGERTELSATTYANWVAKTASLLVEELDLERGGRLLVDLPTHWLTPVFAGAAWTVGLCVVTEGDADAVVCGPDSLTAYAGHAASVPVVASALHPLGMRFADPLPDGVHDFGVEVWSQPDAFVPWDPPTDDDEALPGTTQAALLDGGGRLVAPGGRLLTTVGPLEEPATLVDALVGHGSTVWWRNPDPETRSRKVGIERTTAEHLPDLF